MYPKQRSRSRPTLSPLDAIRRSARAVSPNTCERCHRTKTGGTVGERLRMTQAIKRRFFLKNPAGKKKVVKRSNSMFFFNIFFDVFSFLSSTGKLEIELLR